MMESALARFLRCIGEPTRIEIVKLLAEGEKCVGEIAVALGKDQPLISHHLKALRVCRIVTERQEAQKVFYGLMDDRLSELVYSTEALMTELALCNSEEVCLEGRHSQGDRQEDICQDSQPAA